jgi:hypothetical protein
MDQAEDGREAKGEKIMAESPLKPLIKKSKKGFRGYPLATVAFYGPDNVRASKVAVGIIRSEGAEPSDLKRWTVVNGDIRSDLKISRELLEFVRSNGVLSVVMTDRIIGCPHEEGTDYPDGGACPKCPFWAGKNRFKGEYEH